jgi:hypothetical protein
MNVLKLVQPRLWFGMTLAALLGCSTSVPSIPSSPSGSITPEPSAWERAQYVDKVARALRAGRGADGAELEALTPLAAESVVEHYLGDPAVAETVLDFNFFFLGLKQRALKKPNGEFDEARLGSRRAIHSAREFARGGNYLSLLAFDQPLFQYATAIERRRGEESMSEREVLERRYSTVKDDLRVWTQAATTGVGPSQFCEPAFGRPFLDFPYVVGLGQDLAEEVFFDEQGYGMFFLPCRLFGRVPTDKVEAVRRMRVTAELLYQLKLEALSQGNATPKRLADLVEIPLDKLKLAGATQRLDAAFFFELVNSSTNYNRKRAAYILERYFCDDLKPVNVVLPSDHATGAHGSDPSCFSCHYKLDPMAGFFRNLGVSGYDFSNADSVTFDDLAELPRDVYFSTWRSPDGAPRTWNVGYIRSSTDESLNTYGESLKDLFEIIQQAPEAKRCLVRRAFEYFNGQKQLVDPGHIDELAKQFTEEAAVNSSLALKKLFSRILTGATFRTLTPRSDVCYEVSPGEENRARPPCAVAFVLQQNCVGCHGASGAQGGLDLSGWTRDAAGVATFPHRDSSGSQLTAKDTFDRIIERLTTNDVTRAMPFGKSISARDREALFLWAQEYQVTP